MDLDADAGVVAFYRGLGREAPPPAAGELPDLTAKPAHMQAPVASDGGDQDEPAPQEAGTMGMGEIMGELVSLLAHGGRAWARAYELIATVAERGLFRPEFRSYSAWMRDLAAKTGVTEGLLWHRKSAGDWYTAWAAEHPEAPSLAEGAGLSEENLNLVRKISSTDGARTDELMAGIQAGTVTTRDLRREWREVRQRENPGEPEVKVETTPAVRWNKRGRTFVCADDAACDRVVEALRAAGIELAVEL